MQVHNGVENLQLINPVVTIGSFDGVHKGHVQVIQALKKVAQQLGGESVIISFDPHPREVLYPLEKRPGILTTLEEKRQLLESYGVDHLVILSFTRALAELNYADFVRHILVDKIGIQGLVVGYDHRFGKGREGDFEALRSLSEKYEFYIEQEPAYEEHEINVSSTKIRTALELGNINRVQEFLGYDYPITGKVVYGEKIGRGIGFPTANLQVEDGRKLLPAMGVYAVEAKVGGESYGGMLNIGVRPTVSCAGVVRLEVHIFDFQGNIYGEEVTVYLKERIRGEQKFHNIEELRLQLLEDQKRAKQILNI